LPAEAGEAVAEGVAIAEKGDGEAKPEKKAAARKAGPRKAKEKASAE
jgi:hypothetical protein